MKNKKLTIAALIFALLIYNRDLIWADLTNYTEALLNSLTAALDSDHDGDFTDETWYTDLTGKISSLAEDTTPELGGNLDQNGSIIYEDSATAFTDSDAPSPDLASAHQIITFTDDGGTDVDTITGFSNIVNSAVHTPIPLISSSSLTICSELS